MSEPMRIPRGLTGEDFMDREVVALKRRLEAVEQEVRELFEAGCLACGRLASIRFIQTGQDGDLLWRFCSNDVPDVHERLNAALDTLLKRYGWPQDGRTWLLTPTPEAPKEDDRE